MKRFLGHRQVSMCSTRTKLIQAIPYCKEVILNWCDLTAKLHASTLKFNELLHCTSHHFIQRVHKPFLLYTFFFRWTVHTSHEEDGWLVRMKLQLPGNPRSIKVGIPPAFFLILRVLVLVRRADERDAEEALLSVHLDPLLPGGELSCRVLLSCHREQAESRRQPKGYGKQPLILKCTTDFYRSKKRGS